MAFWFSGYLIIPDPVTGAREAGVSTWVRVAHVATCFLRLQSDFFKTEAP